MPRENDRLRLEQSELRARRAEAEAAELRVEVRELEAEQQQRQSEQEARVRFEKFTLWRRLIDGVWWALVIASTSFPLREVEPLARLFSGKETQFAGIIRIILGYGVVVTVCWITTVTLSVLRKRKIESQRERLAQLERELERNGALIDDLKSRLAVLQRGGA